MRIQAKHTLGLIAFSLVPLAFAMGLGYTRSRGALLATERRRLDMLGTLKVAQLRSELEAHAGVAHRLRAEFLKLELGEVAEALRGGAWADWLRGAAASVGPETELSILDLNGTVKASTRSGLPGRTWAGAPRIEAGRVQPQFVGPHARPDDDVAIEDAVYVPLTGLSGTTVAQLAVTGSNASLQNWLFDDLTPGTRATLETLSGQPLAVWPLPSADPDVESGDHVEASFRLGDGGAKLTLSTHEARALGPLVRLRQLGVLALLSVALAVVALAILLGRSLASPVHALVRQAGRVGAGELLPFARYPHDDEFAILWRAMDQMRAQLVEARDRVQQLLDERTRALIGQQQLVGSLFEALPDVVFVVTPDHRVTAANRTARRLYGDDVEQRACHEVLYARAAPCLDCPLARVLSGDCKDHAAISVVTATHEAVALTLSLIGPSGASSATALYAGRVVTQERMLQTRLAHQEKMAALGALAAGVAHEVRNPLASLSSLVQLRLRSDKLDDLTRKDLTVVLDQVERIDRTVKNLTYAAREPQSGRRPALLQDLVERVVQLARYDPRARGVALTTRCDRDAPPLQLDEDAWVQVLLNLVVNALDAVETSAERKVCLEVARTDAGVELAVRDTGCGMSESVLRKATAPLFTTKPPGRGTGLGLHLVREVVEQHGGLLDITSAEGRGTVVRIALSVRPKTATLPPTADELERT